MTVPLIMLLGRKDEPTDAVEEYCQYLGKALEAHDIQLQIRRVPWELHGWTASLDTLKLMATGWRNTWVLVQYTALSWSARGFPLRVARVFSILTAAGARVGIVFHDVEPNQGTRLIDAVRRFIQVRTMRRALARADLAVVTVIPERLSWIRSTPRRLVFIPVGAMLPIPSETIRRAPSPVPTIGVFSITGGKHGERETEIIIRTIRHAADKLGPLRVSVFGRHAELRQQALEQGFEGTPVEVSVEGVIDPDQVVQRLFGSDVFLFVRGAISSRRSSAIAGIAAGLPVIAFSGSETAAPIIEAGVILVSPNEPEKLDDHLVRILSDPVLLADLADRSRSAYLKHFAWPAIAKRYAEALRSRP